MYLRRRCRKKLKRGKLTGISRTLHREEIPNLFASPRNVARRGQERNGYKILVVNPEGRSLLGKPLCRWEDEIKNRLGVGGSDSSASL
jgi:hypothetical protein